MNAVRSALTNSLLLGLATATIGTVLMGLLCWIVYRSRLPGRGIIEYVAMFPQAVPRLVFAFGMMWAWLVIPLPIYGTIWLLLIAYLTVFLPLGMRTISGVMLQLDKTLEESAQMCGAPWIYRLRTVTMPLLRPGLLACWLLLFIASVRELGASILLMGPHSKVITPAIVESWFATSTRTHRRDGADPDRGGSGRHGNLRHADAPGGRPRRRLTWQTATPLPRSPRRDRPCRAQPIEVRRPAHPIRPGRRRAGRQLRRATRRATDPARPLRLRQDDDAARTGRAGAAERAAPSASAAKRVLRCPAHRHSGREARTVDGVPVLCDLAAHDGVRQRRLRPAGAQTPEGRDRDARCARRSTWCRWARFADASRLATFRRTAAARGAGARLRLLAAGAVVRRAAIQSGRQVARRHAHRAARAAAPAGRHVGLCHPRPGRGAGDVGPHRGDARRRHRAGRHAGGDL